MHEWCVRKIPRVRMSRIDPTERGEKLAGFELKIEGQVSRLQKYLLNFHRGLVVVVQFEDNVGKAFEVRIDRAVEGKLDVTRIEAALLWIVISYFNVIE